MAHIEIKVALAEPSRTDELVPSYGTATLGEIDIAIPDEIDVALLSRYAAGVLRAASQQAADLVTAKHVVKGAIGELVAGLMAAAEAERTDEPAAKAEPEGASDVGGDLAFEGAASRD